MFCFSRWLEILDNKKIKKRKLANGDWGVPEYQGYQSSVGTSESQSTTWTSRNDIDSIAEFKMSEAQQESFQEDPMCFHFMFGSHRATLLVFLRASAVHDKV